MHPWLRTKQKRLEVQARDQEPHAHNPRRPISKTDRKAEKETRRSTAAYHPPEKTAPRHVPNRRHVKDLLTNHWDLDSLSRADYEAVMRAAQNQGNKPSKDSET